ncbi:hypothetical protein CRM22_004050 [Opisthorchis felineus]|uniref:Uncharacterized protein n=1 Tax=Opisthorchis felineus TaxID=147828 RepID=A0A4S2LYA6_OPIFE|nr:hypothetical protein CRM22_004050 [Opisthorchis felineus]
MIKPETSIDDTNAVKTTTKANSDQTGDSLAKPAATESSIVAPEAPATATPAPASNTTASEPEKISSNPTFLADFPTPAESAHLTSGALQTPPRTGHQTVTTPTTSGGSKSSRIKEGSYFVLDCSLDIKAPGVRNWSYLLLLLCLHICHPPPNTDLPVLAFDSPGVSFFIIHPRQPVAFPKEPDVFVWKLEKAFVLLLRLKVN